MITGQRVEVFHCPPDKFGNPGDKVSAGIGTVVFWGASTAGDFTDGAGFWETDAVAIVQMDSGKFLEAYPRMLSAVENG